jgi:hypothetical protein
LHGPCGDCSRRHGRRHGSPSALQQELCVASHHHPPPTHRFPHCLAMLELLQSQHFREAIALPQTVVRWELLSG